RAKLQQLQRAAAANPIPGVIPFSFRQVGDVFLLDDTVTQPIVIDDDVSRPTGYRWAAVWAIPTRELIKTFERRVEDLGWWYKYFGQKNAWGELNPQATFSFLVGGPPRPSSTVPAPAPVPVPAPIGRFARTRSAVRKLRNDVEELKRDVSVVVDYVKTQQGQE